MNAPNPHTLDANGRHDEHACDHCQRKPPKALCRICKNLYREPGASLGWYVNAHGRGTCPACRN